MGPIKSEGMDNQTENPVVAKINAGIRSRSNSFKKNVKKGVDKAGQFIFPAEEEGNRSRGHSFGMQPYVGNINVEQDKGSKQKSGFRSRTVSFGATEIKLDE